MSKSLLQTRKLDPDSPLLGRIGTLETRLARSKAEVKAAQALRYEVFYEELGAQPTAANKLLKRDKDLYDRHCDHLLVIDRNEGDEKIVGTYRLLLAEHAKVAGGFYSEGEFNLRPLLESNADQNFLELGRSCILPAYRSKRTMELLWQGTWAYAVENKIDIMFGCASFSGVQTADNALAFSWLAENAVLKNNENCPARNDCVFLNATDDNEKNARRALSSMPPLLKGYLRLGAKVASQAVIDRQFDTTDVLVVLKVADINPRYIAHYGADASRFAA